MNLSDAATTTDSDLSTSLPEQLRVALEGAHRLLLAHQAHLPSALLAELEALPQRFGNHSVRIAVCGEVKAGKSTLLNAIAGATLSPVAFEPLTNVPVRVTHGPSTTWRIGTQSIAGIADLEAQMRRNLDGRTEVVVETNLDLLQLGGQVELLDTPGMGSDAHTDTISVDALRSLDAIVLVVRYPALFTEYTRQLAQQLHHDISKLFVVWNLDASCRDLSDAERVQHAATLRGNLSGAHDVFFVDARQACETHASDPDPSGLWYLTTALRTFLSSNSRTLVALRQAAKHGQQLLASAQEGLETRRAAVAMVIEAARQQLSEVELNAKSAADAIHAQRNDFDLLADSLLARGQVATTQAATKLRKALRSARRRWVWNGNLGELDGSVAAALQDYAEAVANSGNSAVADMQSHATALGAACTLEQRPPQAPNVDALAPGGRGTLASTGNWQLVRRALWPSWYLEGLDVLDRDVIAADLTQQAEWLNLARQRACRSVSDAGDQHLQDIDAHRQAGKQRIEEETELLTYESEAQELASDSPQLSALVSQLNDLAVRARATLA